MDGFRSKPAARVLSGFTAIERRTSTVAWLQRQSDIPEQARLALLEAETRPRIDTFDQGLICIIRGAALHAEGDSLQLISLRMWWDKRRLITLRGKAMQAPEAMKSRLEKGFAVESSAQLLLELITLNATGLGDLIEDLEENVGELEEQSLLGKLPSRRDKLILEQRCIVAFRRHMAPQTFAMGKLRDIAEFTPQQDRLRELENRHVHMQEELNFLAERCLLLKGELGSHVNRAVEKRMRLLTILGAIFLPLSFLTDLLGINVGGIPGKNSDLAFWVIAAIMLALLLLQLAWFRWRRWI